MDEVSRSFGLPGVALREGDHLCGFYRGEAERDAILRPYLAEGLRAGDKCFCIIDASTPDEVVAMFPEAGTEPGRAPSLGVVHTTQAHLRSGAFDPDLMISFWDETVTEALGRDYSFFRGFAEMTWALREAPGVEKLAVFESKLNEFLPRYPQAILCMYDLTRFSGDVIIDMLKTHPRVLLNGSIFDNPYYVSPAEFLATRS